MYDPLALDLLRLNQDRVRRGSEHIWLAAPSRRELRRTSSKGRK